MLPAARDYPRAIAAAGRSARAAGIAVELVLRSRRAAAADGALQVAAGAAGVFDRAVAANRGAAGLTCRKEAARVVGAVLNRAAAARLTIGRPAKAVPGANSAQRIPACPVAAHLGEDAAFAAAGRFDDRATGVLRDADAIGAFFLGKWEHSCSRMQPPPHVFSPGQQRSAPTQTWPHFVISSGHSHWQVL